MKRSCLEISLAIHRTGDSRLAVPSLWASAPARQQAGMPRAAFKSNAHVSVLISTGIASLGCISKDSVTNEKHTSSRNEVNFFKKKKRGEGELFCDSVDIY